MKNINVKNIALVTALAFVLVCTVAMAVAMGKEEAPRSQTVVTYVPNEDVKNVEKWIKVEIEGEIYLITENLDRAYLWNSQHSILPHMYFEVCEGEEIPNLEDLLENAENFYEIEKVEHIQLSENEPIGIESVDDAPFDDERVEDSVDEDDVELEESTIVFGGRE